ncbi:MAG: alpha/beta hydrolase [Alphaproteobacteria bacterium]
MTDAEQRLQVRGQAPDWFHWAIGQRGQSRRVEVKGCSIHYLSWQPIEGAADPGSILFLHGGGAHAHWWSHIAPYFRAGHRVAAMDLSGMGDSGERSEYNASLRAAEIHAVIEAAGLGPKTYLVGHSFGGFMAMRYAAEHSDRLAGLVIADSPLYPPGAADDRRRQANPMGAIRIYPTFEEAVSRFRLRPRQPCDNEFIVEYIARHSIKAVAGGFTWKFDTNAMAGRRFAEPFHEHLAAANCRAAMFRAEKSALVTDEMARYANSLMGPKAPLVVIPDAHHHLILDQPLAFVAALATLLETWKRDGKH